MTVCIAAHCFEPKIDSQCLICVADNMISTGEMSADHSARKIQVIGNGWVAMFAGNDISCLTPIITHVRRAIGYKRAAIEDVAAAFVGAYREQLNLLKESEVLTPISYSIEEFKSKGLAQLGPEIFARVLYDMERQVIDLSFLVAGFDEDETSHIFTVCSPGKVDYYTELGFWAIGSGQTHALGSIFNSPKRIRFIGRAGTLYRVCEAKFNAENALGVGPTTSVVIIEKNGARRHLPVDDIDRLRPVWENTRVMEVPNDGIEIATHALTAKPDSEPSA
jgi:20S proteasome alpha/beta subunit